jgi:ParB-like chromosome segregation protein Spo0J
MPDSIRAMAQALAQSIDSLHPDERIEALNIAREELHAISPFRNEPVDFVRWVPAPSVVANDYNPNAVAPPEMRLLELSILADGYTQPIVTHAVDQSYLVVDGFHRNRVGRENETIAQRIVGHLPVVQIRLAQSAEPERMASTIRHNRARGRHGVEPMQGIVAYLVKKGWDDNRISRQLGMEADEVLRFKQITGLSELFANRDFSEAWDVA